MGLSPLVLLALLGDPQEPPAFRIDVTPPVSCKRATVCEAKLRLVALDKYKVNAEYPFKFTPDANAALTYEGTGKFTHDDKKSGTLTIKFKADKAGKVDVSGLFKLSVCTEDLCKIEKPKVSFSVTISS